MQIINIKTARILDHRGISKNIDVGYSTSNIKDLALVRRLIRIKTKSKRVYLTYTKK